MQIALGARATGGKIGELSVLAGIMAASQENSDDSPAGTSGRRKGHILVWNSRRSPLNFRSAILPTPSICIGRGRIEFSGTYFTDDDFTTTLDDPHPGFSTEAPWAKCE